MKLSNDELYVALIWRQFKDDPARLRHILNLELTQSEQERRRPGMTWLSWLIVLILLPGFLLYWAALGLAKAWRNYE